MNKIKNVKINDCLKNENCFDFLPKIETKSIDLILLDPPYVISRDSTFHITKNNKFNFSIDFGEWDKNFDGLKDVIQECYRCLKDAGTIICFYDLFKITILKAYLEEAKFKQIRFIEWVKTNPVPVNSKHTYLSNAREIALEAVKKGKSTFNSEYDNGVYKFPICHDKDRFHPTQKPLELMEALIKKHSNEGDLIMDCFAGSASTAIAAYNLNRNFIGCEISEEYYKKALKRINGEIKAN